MERSVRETAQALLTDLRVRIEREQRNATATGDDGVLDICESCSELRVLCECGVVGAAERDALVAALSGLLEENAELRDALGDMVWQHAYETGDSANGGRATSGLSANEAAFAALGLPDPASAGEIAHAAGWTPPQHPAEGGT